MREKRGVELAACRGRACVYGEAGGVCGADLPVRASGLGVCCEGLRSHRRLVSWQGAGARAVLGPCGAQTGSWESGEEAGAKVQGEEERGGGQACRSRGEGGMERDRTGGTCGLGGSGILLDWEDGGTTTRTGHW